MRLGAEELMSEGAVGRNWLKAKGGPTKVAFYIEAAPLPDAALLTSLLHKHLSQAIEEKKRCARIIGRGWRVKREELDAYVKKL